MVIPRGTRRLSLLIGLLVTALSVAFVAYGVHEHMLGIRAKGECVRVCGVIVDRIAAHMNAGTLKGMAVVALEQGVPSTERGLVRRGPNGLLVDPWGTPLRIEYKNVSRGLLIRVRSAGPAGVFGRGNGIEGTFVYQGIRIGQDKLLLHDPRATRSGGSLA